jgi:hypothetical protein
MRRRTRGNMHVLRDFTLRWSALRLTIQALRRCELPLCLTPFRGGEQWSEHFILSQPFVPTSPIQSASAVLPIVGRCTADVLSLETLARRQGLGRLLVQ